MILYHGSNVEVKEPRLLKIQRKLDFGNGFYTTSDLEQATKWAKRTALRFNQKNAYVNVYEINDTEMQDLKILYFYKPDDEWLHYVVQNRKGESVANDWDIIIGSVANDQTITVIDFFINGIYNEKEAIKRLLTQRLKNQYTFKTKKSIELLHYKESIQL